MAPRPLWHVCAYDDSSHLAGHWCERAGTSTSAAFTQLPSTAPRAAALASSHRTTRTLPVFTPLGVSSRFSA